jgi:hypothetical protein
MGSAMDRWTIGNRNKSKADLYLDDATVSGIHAELFRIDDRRFRLHDCQSTNGTARLVNGRWVRITDASVSPDERLRFGRVETSVRELLRNRPGSGPKQYNRNSGDSWPNDLAEGFAQIRHLNILKANFYFTLHLIASPVQRTLVCVERGRPVNPYCFMIFGALIFTANFTIPEIVEMIINPNAENFHKMILGQFGRAIALIALIVSFNIPQHKVFGFFSKNKRLLDESMKLTAVSSGFYCVLLGFLNLLLREKDEFTQSVALLIFPLLITYILFYQIAVLKHFWRITYLRTITNLFSYYLILSPIYLVPILAIY